MQEKRHKIAKGEKIGHLDTEDILRIQLEYVKYVTD
jgi:hypothetical protein